MNEDDLKNKVNKAVNLLIKEADPSPNEILIVGCSSSEVLGENIGSATNKKIGKSIYQAVKEVADSRGIFLAAQGCEHTNRSIFIERECLEYYNLEEINIIPQLKAGGAFAAAAYNDFSEPTAVEEIRADMGIDIGDTFIGMHLKEVAVPVRINFDRIGKAHLTLARTRPKMVGGERAEYKKL